MPFGMGFGELVLILIIVVVVFGATKLPSIADSLGPLRRGERRAPPRLLLERRRPWTRWDWALVVSATVLGMAMIALFLRAH